MRKPRRSQAIVLDAPPAAKTEKLQSKGLLAKAKAALKKSQYTFLHTTGIVMVSRKYCLSEPLDQWIHEFAPDIVYVSASDICKFDFIAELKKRYGFKLIIHIFDDYINSQHQYTAFPKYWKNRLDSAFRRFVSLADLHLAIGDKMAAEYSEKYGKQFHAYHNPIDPTVWLREPANTKQRDDSVFDFLYAGKINQDTVGPLKRFIDATAQLRSEGHLVRLRLYSPYPLEEIRLQLGDKVDDVYMGCADYNDLPDIFRAADGLLLPLDFSPATVQYIRLSMLTKVTEYMISGTPIFLFAPHNIAVTEFLLKHDAAFHADNPDQLAQAILFFVENKSMQKRVSQNALTHAKENHLQEIVNNNLHKLITTVALAEKCN